MQRRILKMYLKLPAISIDNYKSPTHSKGQCCESNIIYNTAMQQTLIYSSHNNTVLRSLIPSLWNTRSDVKVTPVKFKASFFQTSYHTISYIVWCAQLGWMESFAHHQHKFWWCSGGYLNHQWEQKAPESVVLFCA